MAKNSRAKQSADTGTALEARIQRLIFAQALFAERALFPAASSDHRLLATDIDVLASEYHANFHVTRSHYECKGGKKAPTLDRVLWLAGVQRLLTADGSYLVISTTDDETVRFARQLGIEVIPLELIDSLEQRLSVTPNEWPARSNYRVYDQARQLWREHYQRKEPEEHWLLVKEATTFVDVDSWNGFDYRRLNKLLRLLAQLGNLLEIGSLSDDLLTACHYVTSALLVRFCQYVLELCRDVAHFPDMELAGYLSPKLAFGDNNPQFVLGLMTSAVRLAAVSSESESHKSPALDYERLTSPPAYAEDLVTLIREMRQHPNAARRLPLAMELRLFGDPASPAALECVRAAVDEGKEITGLICGFAIRSLNIPKRYTDSCFPAVDASLNSGTDANP